MSKSKRQAQPSQLLNNLISQRAGRAGREGHFLPATQFSVGGDNKESVSIGLDLSDAPVPQRRYAADICVVREKAGDLQFVFGQERLTDASLDSAIVIRMNPEAASRFFQSIEQMNQPTLGEIAFKMNITPVPLGTIPGEPAQMASMVANIGSLAIAGYESCIDFYHASPFSVRDASSQGGLRVEPVVRVDIRTSQLLAIVERMKELSPNWMKF